MMRLTNTLLIGFLLLTFIICASLIIPEKSTVLADDDRLSKVLSILGDTSLDNYYPNTKEFGVSAKRGEALIKYGFSTKPGGGETNKQSKHFVCTSCHNLEKEDPDLSVSDPQARLEYTSANGLPFLQGTSLYGAVNRESFYNDDYYKKYGDLVWPARNNIREAIQLCAVECAQGRKLKSWEIESILAYLWSIDLKISDLDLSQEEQLVVENSIDSKVDQQQAIDLLKSKYLQGSPAHFKTAIDSRTEANQLAGNPDNGKLIYENSCLHCHQNRRYSYFLLDNDKLTFKHLKKKSGGYGSHSIYQVARAGVYSKSGKRSYMPQYPTEKMSEQQLSDLQAYIDMRAE